MRITRNVIVLSIALAFLKFSPSLVHADNECTQACAASYEACLANAADNYEVCLEYADLNYNGCITQAEAHYDACLDDCNYYYPQYQGCISDCIGRVLTEGQECLDSLSGADANCTNTQATANNYCAGTYSACVGNCPQP